MTLLDKLMRPRVIGFGSLAVASLSLVAFWQAGASAIDNAPRDDGTYLETVVKSFEECSRLCEADSGTCRGAQSEQPDITKPLIICRLNNGFGANPLFPSVPPTPLNVNIAVTDLNAYRRTHGLAPVVLSEKLSKASQVHAEDLARHGNISHTGSDGSGHGDRVQRQGYYFSIAAENVATGQKSWERVFKAWQDSPGHNENLLRDDVTEFGIALVYEPKTAYQTYWAMVVAAPLEDAPNIRYMMPASPNSVKTH
ncbi:MAG: CAP domain-containing protein [Robiginitomaculum sp.]|nr:CAP domain-containing protein [Robiginitomaculum sp.]